MSTISNTTTSQLTQGRMKDADIQLLEVLYVKGILQG